MVELEGVLMDQPSPGAMLIAHPSMSANERAYSLMHDYLDRAATLWLALNGIEGSREAIRQCFAEEAEVTMTLRTTGPGW